MSNNHHRRFSGSVDSCRRIFLYSFQLNNALYSKWISLVLCLCSCCVYYSLLYILRTPMLVIFFTCVYIACVSIYQNTIIMLRNLYKWCFCACVFRGYLLMGNTATSGLRKIGECWSNEYACAVGDNSNLGGRIERVSEGPKIWASS